MNIKILSGVVALIIAGVVVLTATLNQKPSTQLHVMGSGIDPHDPPPGEDAACSPSPTPNAE